MPLPSVCVSKDTLFSKCWLCELTLVPFTKTASESDHHQQTTTPTPPSVTTSKVDQGDPREPKRAEA